MMKMPPIPIKYMGPFWQYDVGEKVAFSKDGKTSYGVVEEIEYEEDGVLIKERAVKVDE